MKVRYTNPEIKQPIIAEYSLQIDKHIEFLFDYSKFLCKKKHYDPDILQWQIENSNLLKPMGVDVNSIKSVILYNLEI